eukprot:GHVP01049126.1.p1 GENE.GHVP01049126.1~~GHVP01049126.1.p1  ORF type:complete len:203 (-),score=14.16 GHVP01049126.1:20-628(-)
MDSLSRRSGAVSPQPSVPAIGHSPTSDFNFIPKSTGIIKDLPLPELRKPRKGYTMEEIKAYRNWASELRKEGKIAFCLDPKFIAEANLVRKPDRTYRITHNFGPLRNITAVLKTSISKIQDLIHKLANYSYLVKIDLSKAFNHSPLIEEERKYYCFRHPINQQVYQYNTLPMGAINSSQLFHDHLDQILNCLPQDLRIHVLH